MAAFADSSETRQRLWTIMLFLAAVRRIMEKESRRVMHYIIAIAGILSGVALDQLTKYYALTRLKDQDPYVIIKGVFQLEYLENRGAAFGLFQNQRFFFYLSVAAILMVVIWFYIKVPMERHYMPLRICAVFIASGALGNFIDRVRLNYVVDVLYFKLIDFPIFNVADIYVTVTTILLFLLICFYYKEDELERILHGGK